jgi:steroid Delta-isomerase
VGFPLVTGRTAIETGGQGYLSLFKTVGLTETYVHAVGLRAVVHWTGQGILQDGRAVSFEGINVFEFDATGKVTKLEGY